MDAQHDKARKMLRIQGALLDKWLEQNLGTRYAFVILAAPGDDLAGGLHCIHNLRCEDIAERLMTDFARQLHAKGPPSITPARAQA